VQAERPVFGEGVVSAWELCQKCSDPVHKAAHEQHVCGLTPLHEQRMKANRAPGSVSCGGCGGGPRLAHMEGGGVILSFLCAGCALRIRG